MRKGLILAGLTLLLFAVPAHAQGDQFVGQIQIVSFNFAPKGWAFCAGQLLPINQNQALFSLLGTQFGGDGITNFALPDLRGRMAIGQGQGPGLANYTVGQTGGEESVTLTLNQLPAHSHAAMASSGAASALGPGSSEWAATTTYLYSSTASTLVPMNSGTVGLMGGGQAHENRSPYLAMNFIIALQGIFPSRD
jgi:microcystin-dependent protein